MLPCEVCQCDTFCTWTLGLACECTAYVCTRHGPDVAHRTGFWNVGHGQKQVETKSNCRIVSWVLALISDPCNALRVDDIPVRYKGNSKHRLKFHISRRCLLFRNYIRSNMFKCPQAKLLVSVLKLSSRKILSLLQAYNYKKTQLSISSWRLQSCNFAWVISSPTFPVRMHTINAMQARVVKWDVLE